ncbi:MAG: hypothetical protein LAT51_02490 [Flavobacteriaceae bacterium]|nr:hypothetical protein [Flavobacteriaceae bacterium]
MKKIIALVIVMTLGFSFQSCQEEAKKDDKEKVSKESSSNEVEALQKEFNTLMKESVKAHDEVMPKMGTINEHIAKLEELQNEVDEEKIEVVVEDLKKGHDMMMSWMKGFGNDFSREEINQGIQENDLTVLKSKVDLVEKHHQSALEMKQQIKNSLEASEQLLSNY